MANFAPLKQYMLYCLDRFVERYRLAPPFLEVGCGTGEVSAHLAARGWPGLAIDVSEVALARAAERLAPWPGVTLSRRSLHEVEGSFATIVMWDVLEHIDDDRAALATLARLLAPGGQLLLAVPSNPREWRWDDDFYGHVRRYTVDELDVKLGEAGLAPRAYWDFTWPLFWALRRGYTRLKRPAPATTDREAATRVSATVNAWDLPLVSRLLDRSVPLWRPLYAAQFRLFRGATARGHELFALAHKPAGDATPPRS